MRQASGRIWTRLGAREFSAVGDGTDGARLVEAAAGLRYSIWSSQREGAMTTRHMVAMGALAAGVYLVFILRRDADANAVRDLRHTRRS